MAFFSFHSIDHDPRAKHLAGDRIIVDLTTFCLGATPLGARPSPGDVLAINEEVLHGPGIEVGLIDGVLDYGFFTLGEFAGSFKAEGRLIPLGTTTTEEDILALFGEPYWVDRSNDEVLFFYDFRSGTIELQFEFSPTLGFITLTRNGVLAEASGRAGYRVTKPWPPLT